LRPDSPTYRQWVGATLTAANAEMLYVPEGFAHGYLTLEPDTEVLYLASVAYAPGAATGVRFDDPAFSIQWPRDVSVISAADRAWPDFV
jgi:dTDP-4-dehydrorhamnose 3,5-epimerase